MVTKLVRSGCVDLIGRSLGLRLTVLPLPGNYEATSGTLECYLNHFG